LEFFDSSIPRIWSRNMDLRPIDWRWNFYTDILVDFYLDTKRILQTVQYMGDPGWQKLSYRRDMIKLRYWKKLSEMDDSRLVKKIYLEDSSSLKLDSWSYQLRKIMLRLELNEDWYYNSTKLSTTEWEKIIDSLLYNEFITNGH